MLGRLRKLLGRCSPEIYITVASPGGVCRTGLARLQRRLGTEDLRLIGDMRFGNRPLGDLMILLLPGTLARAHYGGYDERSHR